MRIRASVFVAALLLLAAACSSPNVSKTVAAEPKSKLPEVNDANFAAQVLQSDKPVLVDFWAPWCGPCKTQGPIVELVGGKYEARLKTVKVNVDEATETARRYSINAIPTLILFKDGKAVFTRVGLTQEKDLSAAVEKAIQ